jgi:hypothetical protein
MLFYVLVEQIINNKSQIVEYEVEADFADAPEDGDVDSLQFFNLCIYHKTKPDISYNIFSCPAASIIECYVINSVKKRNILNNNKLFNTKLRPVADITKLSE